MHAKLNSAAPVHTKLPGIIKRSDDTKPKVKVAQGKAPTAPNKTTPTVAAATSK